MIREPEDLPVDFGVCYRYPVASVGKADNRHNLLEDGRGLQGVMAFLESRREDEGKQGAILRAKKP